MTPFSLANWDDTSQPAFPGPDVEAQAGGGPDFMGTCGKARERKVALGGFRQPVARKRNDSLGRFVIAGRRVPAPRHSFSTLPRVREKKPDVAKSGSVLLCRKLKKSLKDHKVMGNG
jgi:hypothetical protein